MADGIFNDIRTWYRLLRRFSTGCRLLWRDRSGSVLVGGSLRGGLYRRTCAMMAVRTLRFVFEVDAAALRTGGNVICDFYAARRADVCFVADGVAALWTFDHCHIVVF